MSSIITKIINFRKLKKSFQVAIRGVIFAFRQEQTFRIQVVLGFLAIFFAFYFPLSSVKRALVFLATAGVLGMELLNTQLEKILDLVQPKEDLNVRFIKDLSAGAVLIMALGAFLLGIVIFLPEILKIFIK